MKKSLITFAVINLFLTASFGQTQKKELTLKEIWASKTFFAETVEQPNSMQDGEHFTALEEVNGDIVLLKYNYKSGKVVDTLLKQSQITSDADQITIQDYQFSPDESSIMISTGMEQIYRHSFRSSNYIYDFKTKKITPLSKGTKQMYPSFSPDGSKIAFVRDNNIFIKDLKSGKELTVTTTGKQNRIINGATDWVYEEEFSFDKAMFWNRNGEKLAYYEFDETNVPEFTLIMYGGALYPGEYKYKYPKAGETNSNVSIYVYDVKASKNVKMETGNDTDQYIPRVKWTQDPAVLSIQRMNRHQNKLELLFADAASGKTKVVLKEENNTYIDISDNLTFLADGKSFIWTSELEGYNHIYHYDINGKLIKKITSGSWDVDEMQGVDEQKKLIYFTSAENGATDRDLFVVKIDGSGKRKLSQKNGTNKVAFSNGLKYFLNTHSDANTPYFVSLHASDGKQIRVLQDNKKLIDTLAHYKMSKKEFFKFKTSEGVELNGWMIKPADFDQNKKYPMFMTVYGGPGHNTVNNSWEAQNYLWHEMIAQKGYIVVSVDNRGTGYRGEKFKKSTYKQLGKLETIDQIEAAKYFQSLPYVDRNRIGIEGWSFGGYLTSLCATKAPDLFKMAIAIAPVTNWKFYDSIYTERFLQTPKENPEGYEENSPINFVKNLKCKYMLVHGSADDNVHVQNTMEMINALVKANKQFDLFVYPDKNHGIYGGLTRLHLFTKMTDFITENL